ncbi:MAG: hypothetical protein PHC88_00785 [Terrimicrobiaceae bacterium]|nr:hypothetical protein [Terrimicrobiaceae bacterium]
MLDGKQEGLLRDMLDSANAIGAYLPKKAAGLAAIGTWGEEGRSSYAPADSHK